MGQCVITGSSCNQEMWKIWREAYSPNWAFGLEMLFIRSLSPSSEFFFLEVDAKNWNQTKNSLRRKCYYLPSHPLAVQIILYISVHFCIFIEFVKFLFPSKTYWPCQKFTSCTSDFDGLRNSPGASVMEEPVAFLSLFQLRLVCWCMGPREDTEGGKLKK